MSTLRTKSNPTRGSPRMQIHARAMLNQRQTPLLAAGDNHHAVFTVAYRYFPITNQLPYAIMTDIPTKLNWIFTAITDNRLTLRLNVISYFANRYITLFYTCSFDPAQRTYPVIHPYPAPYPFQIFFEQYYHPSSEKFRLILGYQFLVLKVVVVLECMQVQWLRHRFQESWVSRAMYYCKFPIILPHEMFTLLKGGNQLSLVNVATRRTNRRFIRSWNPEKWPPHSVFDSDWRRAFESVKTYLSGVWRDSYRFLPNFDIIAVVGSSCYNDMLTVGGHALQVPVSMIVILNHSLFTHVHSLYHLFLTTMV